MSTHLPPPTDEERDLMTATFFDISEPDSIVLVPRKAEQTITKIVRERLAKLGLSQIPASANVFLAEKLATLARKQAIRSITPRSIARAILATSSPEDTTSTITKEVAQRPKPTA